MRPSLTRERPASKGVARDRAGEWSGSGRRRRQQRLHLPRHRLAVEVHGVCASEHPEADEQTEQRPPGLGHAAGNMGPVRWARGRGSDSHTGASAGAGRSGAGSPKVVVACAT